MKKYFAVILFLFIAQQAGACFRTLYFEPVTAGKLTAIIEKAQSIGAAVIPQEDNGHSVFVVIDKELATQARGIGNDCGEGTPSANSTVPIHFPVFSNPSDLAQVIFFELDGVCVTTGGFKVGYTATSTTNSPQGISLSLEELARRKLSSHPQVTKEDRNSALNCEVIRALLAQK